MSARRLPGAPANWWACLSGCTGGDPTPGSTVLASLHTRSNALAVRSMFLAIMRCAASIWHEYLPFLMLIAFAS